MTSIGSRMRSGNGVHDRAAPGCAYRINPRAGAGVPAPRKVLCGSMDAHLTRGTRSIPVVMLLDEQYEEVAWWGPRPAELQDWFGREGRQLPKEERYREIRRWYARDRGVTTLTEIAGMIEHAARLQRAA